MRYNFRGISELYKRQTRNRLYAVVLAQNSSSSVRRNLNTRTRLLRFPPRHVRQFDIHENCTHRFPEKSTDFSRFRLSVALARTKARGCDLVSVALVNVPSYPDDHLWIILSKLRRRSTTAHAGTLSRPLGGLPRFFVDIFVAWPPTNASVWITSTAATVTCLSNEARARAIVLARFPDTYESRFG